MLEMQEMHASDEGERRISARKKRFKNTVRTGRVKLTRQLFERMCLYCQGHGGRGGLKRAKTESNTSALSYNTVIK